MSKAQDLRDVAQIIVAEEKKIMSKAQDLRDVAGIISILSIVGAVGWIVAMFVSLSQHKSFLTMIVGVSGAIGTYLCGWAYSALAIAVADIRDRIESGTAPPRMPAIGVSLKTFCQMCSRVGLRVDLNPANATVIVKHDRSCAMAWVSRCPHGRGRRADRDSAGYAEVAKSA